MPASTLQPVNYSVALSNVITYRPIPHFGIIHSPESILHYIQNIFPNIIEQQPEKPQGYNWAVGFYFHKTRSGISFYVAPVLQPTNPASPVLDCFNEEHQQYFNFNITDPNGNEGFVYNDGSKWP